VTQYTCAQQEAEPQAYTYCCTLQLQLGLHIHTPATEPATTEILMMSVCRKRWTGSGLVKCRRVKRAGGPAADLSATTHPCPKLSDHCVLISYCTFQVLAAPSLHASPPTLPRWHAHLQLNRYGRVSPSTSQTSTMETAQHPDLQKSTGQAVMLRPPPIEPSEYMSCSPLGIHARLTWGWHCTMQTHGWHSCH
jgi:hypothetical protein